jgi:DNA mismatch endonuclease (patch repair protein)
MDRLSQTQRSALMRSVRQRGSSPELVVRKMVHALGGRYRLHCKSLPGSPDLVLPGRRLAIFVHGCFWHRHAGCSRASTPKSNVEFWLQKFQANIERDARKEQDLSTLGWRVVTVWECETRDVETLRERLKGALVSSE